MLLTVGCDRLGDPCCRLDRARDPAPQRLLAAEAAVGSRRGDPLRAAASGRARPHRLQETRPDHPTPASALPATGPCGRKARQAGTTSPSRSTTQLELGFAELYPDETTASAIAFLA